MILLFSIIIVCYGRLYIWLYGIFYRSGFSKYWQVSIVNWPQTTSASVSSVKFILFHSRNILCKVAVLVNLSLGTSKLLISWITSNLVIHIHGSSLELSEYSPNEQERANITEGWRIVFETIVLFAPEIKLTFGGFSDDQVCLR